MVVTNLQLLIPSLNLLKIKFPYIPRGVGGSGDQLPTFDPESTSAEKPNFHMSRGGDMDRNWQWLFQTELERDLYRESEWDQSNVKVHVYTIGTGLRYSSSCRMKTLACMILCKFVPVQGRVPFKFCLNNKPLLRTPLFVAMQLLWCNPENTSEYGCVFRYAWTDL